MDRPAGRRQATGGQRATGRDQRQSSSLWFRIFGGSGSGSTDFTVGLQPCITLSLSLPPLGHMVMQYSLNYPGSSPGSGSGSTNNWCCCCCYCCCRVRASWRGLSERPLGSAADVRVTPSNRYACVCCLLCIMKVGHQGRPAAAPGSHKQPVLCKWRSGRSASPGVSERGRAGGGAQGGRLLLGAELPEDAVPLNGRVLYISLSVTLPACLGPRAACALPCRHPAGEREGR